LSKLVKWDGEGISADMTSSLGVKKYHQSQLQSDFIPMLMHEPQRALLPYPGTESRWEWTESVFLYRRSVQSRGFKLDRLPAHQPWTGPPTSPNAADRTACLMRSTQVLDIDQRIVSRTSYSNNYQLNILWLLPFSNAILVPLPKTLRGANIAMIRTNTSRRDARSRDNIRNHQRSRLCGSSFAFLIVRRSTMYHQVTCIIP
jgi:hypothetical protein